MTNEIEKKLPEIRCISCEKLLENIAEEWETPFLFPSNAISFTGSPGYGSSFDSCHTEWFEVGGFQIFLCDRCFKDKQKFIVGIKKPEPTTEFFSWDSLEKRRMNKRVQLEEDERILSLLEILEEVDQEGLDILLKEEYIFEDGAGGWQKTSKAVRLLKSYGVYDR